MISDTEVKLAALRAECDEALRSDPSDASGRRAIRN